MGKEELAEVQCLAPSRWGSERCKSVIRYNYCIKCLEPLGRGMLTFGLRGLENYIQEFNPDVLYVMEEPYTAFALHCTRIAKKYNIPMAIFTWENIVSRRFGGTEKDVIDSSSILVAGNEGAKQRLIHMGADEDKISVCPQTGLSDRFKQLPDVDKTYDAAYFGRMVKEKGIEHIENVVKELALNMLWVGGRGDIIPSYGVYLGWIDYLKLPEYYNKTKLFIHYPYALNGYSEQFAYTLGEAMACGIPVVSSDNGSIHDVYKDAPIIFAEEANEDSLCDAIEYAYENNRENWVEAGINWVRDNLSIPIIARRLTSILQNDRK